MHCVKYFRVRVVSHLFSPYKSRFVESVLIRTCRPVFYWSPVEARFVLISFLKVVVQVVSCSIGYFNSRKQRRFISEGLRFTLRIFCMLGTKTELKQNLGVLQHECWSKMNFETKFLFSVFFKESVSGLTKVTQI